MARSTTSLFVCGPQSLFYHPHIRPCEQNKKEKQNYQLSMAHISTCCNSLAFPAPPSLQEAPLRPPIITRRQNTITAFAAKSGGFSLNSILKRCETCGGNGAVECPGCKGTGKNKKNGNIFERWKCFDCQGFGLKSCPNCGQGGLTPEQRGER